MAYSHCREGISHLVYLKGFSAKKLTNYIHIERNTEKERARESESETVREIRGSEHVPWLGRGRHSPCILPGC